MNGVVESAKESAAIDLLRERLSQIGLADKELSRLEVMKVSLEAEQREMIVSGDFESPEKIGQVSTIRIKLDMIPHRLRQLREVRDGVINELPPLTQQVKGENDRRATALKSIARDGFEAAASKAIGRLLPGLEDERLYQIQDTLWNSSVLGRQVAPIDAWGDQQLDSRKSIEEHHLQLAQSTVWLSERLDKLEAYFVKDGRLNLENVASAAVTRTKF